MPRRATKKVQAKLTDKSMTVLRREISHVQRDVAIDLATLEAACAGGYYTARRDIRAVRRRSNEINQLIAELSGSA